MYLTASNAEDVKSVPREALLEGHRTKSRAIALWGFPPRTIQVHILRLTGRVILLTALTHLTPVGVHRRQQWT